MIQNWILTANDVAVQWARSMERACWQGALLAALVWFVCFVFKRIPLSIRCAFWWLVSLKMLIAISSASLAVPILPGDPAIPRTIPIASVTADETPELTKPSVSLPAPRLSLEADAMFLWMLGLSALGLITVGSLVKTAWTVRAARPAECDSLLENVREISKRLGLSRSPRLLVTDHGGAFVFGSFRPAILLPRSIAETCSPEEIRMILAHECAHIQQGDGWFALVPQVAQIALFFNPIAWWASREYCFAREGRCDRIAIELLSARPDRYGRLLMSLGGAPGRQILQFPGIASHFRVLRRRLAMLEYNAPNKNRRVHRGLIAVLALLSACPVALVQAQNPGPSTPTQITISDPVTPPPATTAQIPVTHSTEILRREATAKPITPASKQKPLPLANRIQPAFASTHAIAKAPNPTVSIQTVTPRPKKSTIRAAAGQIIPVGKASDATVLKVFSIRNGSAQQTAILVNKWLESRSSAKASSDDFTNSVIVSGDRVSVDQVSDLIKALDVAPPKNVQPKPQSKTIVCSLKYVKADEMMKGLQGVPKEGLRFISVNPNTNSMVLVGASPTVDRLRTLITSLDVPNATASPKHESKLEPTPGPQSDSDPTLPTPSPK